MTLSKRVSALLIVAVCSLFPLQTALAQVGGDDINRAYTGLVWAPDGLIGCNANAVSVGTTEFPSETIEYYNQSISPKVEEFQDLYLQASQQFDFPWQLIAALHFRETSFSMSNPNNGQGIWQLYTLVESGEYYFEPGPVSEEDFLEQTGLMVDFFRSKQTGNNPENQSPPISNANQNPEIIKDTAFGYNGRLVIDANDPEDLYPNGYDTAGYVMNMYDEYRMSLLVDSVDEGTVLVPDQRPGVFTVYALISGNTNFICGSSAGLGVSADGFVFPVNVPANEISWCGGSPPGNPNCHGDAWGGSITYYSYDIFAAQGQGAPLVAARGGYIRNTGGKTCADGGQISFWIEADDGNWYWYQHANPATKLVDAGDRVEAGQQVGTIGPAAYVGGTCDNSDPHLHFSAATQHVASMYRGCSQSACPDMDKLIDAGSALLESYNAISQ